MVQRNQAIHDQLDQVRRFLGGHGRLGEGAGYPSCSRHGRATQVHRGKVFEAASRVEAIKAHHRPVVVVIFAAAPGQSASAALGQFLRLDAAGKMRPMDLRDLVSQPGIGQRRQHVLDARLIDDQSRRGADVPDPGLGVAGDLHEHAPVPGQERPAAAALVWVAHAC